MNYSIKVHERQKQKCGLEVDTEKRSYSKFSAENQVLPKSEQRHVEENK